MISIKHLVLNTVALASMGALALAGSSAFAVDGVHSGAESPTSSSTAFTNTFDGTADRKIQIINVYDATVTAHTGMLSIAGESRTAKADKFCVIDTWGGQVNLTFRGGSDDVAVFHALDAGGAVMTYGMYLKAEGGSDDLLLPQANPPAFTISVKNASNCGLGNFQKTIFPVSTEDGPVPAGANFPQNGKIYIDTVVVTATPV